MFARASASQYSAIQSCGSIWVVYSFGVRPRLSINFRDCTRQSTDRVAGDMGIESADRAVELAEDLDTQEGIRCAAQPGGEVRHLLAERRRRCCLAMRAGKHGERGMAACQCGELVRDRGDRRQQDALARLREHERIGEVVDVLRRAGEMHELELAGIRTRRGELFPDEVFDRLDVVIRLPLELLDARESSRIDTPGRARQSGPSRRPGGAKAQRSCRKPPADGTRPPPREHDG